MTYVKATWLASRAEIIASIILSCHFQSPVLNASSLLTGFNQLSL